MSRLRLARQDRKASKAALRQKWLATQQRLRLAATGQGVLLLTLLSLWQEMSGTALHVPDDWWAAAPLLATLKPWLAPEALAELQAFAAAVQSYAAGGGEGEGAGDGGGGGGGGGGDGGPPTLSLTRQESAESIDAGTDAVRELGMNPKAGKKR